MPKGKKQKPRRALSKFQVFCLGIALGLALFYLPSDWDFSPTQLEPVAASDQSIFETYLPRTSPYIQHRGFIVSYDGRTRNPHWVYHKLTRDTIDPSLKREGYDFKEDPSVPAHLRAKKEDYAGAGFDRGHLCPAADCKTQEGMKDSFFMTNVTPQVPAFNRGFWKRLENHVRGLTKQYPIVHVFSGPLYMSHKREDGNRYVCYQVIGKNRVAVPTHFFLLLFVQRSNNKLLNKAFIIPNEAIAAKTPFNRYSATLKEVECASGVSFTNILHGM